jgi:hypothetical protein
MSQTLLQLITHPKSAQGIFVLIKCNFNLVLWMAQQTTILASDGKSLYTSDTLFNGKHTKTTYKNLIANKVIRSLEWHNIL